MSPAVLDYVLSVARIGEAALALKMSPPLAEPPEDDEPAHGEPNVFGLPEGEPIRRKVAGWFRKQGKAVSNWLDKWAAKGKGLPAKIPSMSKYAEPMKTATAPLLAKIWGDSGRDQLTKQGLDPKRWSVTSKHVAEQIDRAAFAFCDSTNAATDHALESARQELREELRDGILDRRESVQELTRRVQRIYHRLSTSHARLIARTEAARAWNTARLVAAFDSGVPLVKRLRLAPGACPVCRGTKAKEPKDGWLLLETIHDDGKGNPDYSKCICPPLHPACACALLLEPAKGG